MRAFCDETVMLQHAWTSPQMPVGDDGCREARQSSELKERKATKFRLERIFSTRLNATAHVNRPSDGHHKFIHEQIATVGSVDSHSTRGPPCGPVTRDVVSGAESPDPRRADRPYVAPLEPHFVADRTSKVNPARFATTQCIAAIRIPDVRIKSSATNGCD